MLEEEEEYVPTGQSAQVPEPAAENLPAGQLRQLAMLVAPGLLKVPAGQGVGVVELQKKPAGHNTGTPLGQ
jgi:hypothetical protein